MPDRELTDALLGVIRQRMEEQGLTGQQVAARCGMPQTTFARKLRGLGDFTVDELDAITVGLGGNVAEELLTEAHSKM